MWGHLVSLLFPIIYVQIFKEICKTTGTCFTFREQGLGGMGNNVKCNFSIHQRKSSQGTSDV